VGEPEKQDLLANAYALLFPIDWPEPFGLVLIEAMACGTPVIAYPCGAVPEIVENGVNGFVVDNLDAAVRAVADAARLNRALCRSLFEERFSVTRMAENYLRIYERLLND
jgi:glycosyltransferase involved in cell wall biosynthesis